METVSPKLAAAFGIGFIGFILAAYSYNRKSDFDDEPINNVEHIVNELDYDVKKVVESVVDHVVENEVDNEVDNEDKDEQGIELVVKSPKKSNMSKFWIGEYSFLQELKGIKKRE